MSRFSTLPSVTFAACLALALSVIGPPCVSAQDAPSQATPTTEAGRAVQQAIRLLEQGDLEGALEVAEPVRRDPEATPLQKSFVGALLLQAGRSTEALEVLGPLADAEDADPAVLYNAGRAALAESEGPRAEGYFLRSITADPTSPAARELGLLYAQLRQRVEAYKLLRPWATLHPDDAQARLAAALLALQLDRPGEAEPLLQGLSLDIPRVRLVTGRLLLAQGEPYGAIDTLEPLLESAPEEMRRDLARFLAEAYLQTGRAADAAQVLEGQVGTDPGAALLLADALYQSGEVEAARETLEPFTRPILDLDRDDLVPNPLLESLLVETGRLEVAVGEPERAIDPLERATLIGPENRQAWQLLGQALAAAGRSDEAETALARYQELAEAEPSDATRETLRAAEVADPVLGAIRRAGEMAARGQTDQAIEMLRQESELTPGDPRPPLVAARLLLTQERAEEAMAAAERALELAPEMADAHYQRGTIHMANGDTEAAEADFRRALELSPEHTATMNDLAVLMIQENRRDEALRLLEQIIALSPDDAVARQNLERLRAADDGG